MNNSTNNSQDAMMNSNNMPQERGIQSMSASLNGMQRMNAEQNMSRSMNGMEGGYGTPMNRSMNGMQTMPRNHDGGNFRHPNPRMNHMSSSRNGMPGMNGSNQGG